MKEITFDEVMALPRDSYTLIDMRSEAQMAYGMIPGAIPVNPEDSAGEETTAGIPADRKLIFYCEIGRRSREIDDSLEPLSGRDCYSLAGGYIGYVRAGLHSETDKDERRERAEQSIRKKFHKHLFTPFARACKTYRLIEDGDRIAVCISGGKDSMLMAKLFQEIKRHRQVDFSLTFLVMDPGYNKDNRALIESNAEALGIPITIFESTIFDTVDVFILIE